jgi:hypothetical protein
MKFRIGDATDAALCVALKHEFLRCEDSFDDFASSATLMIARGENRRIAYRTYNAYARFIHHLYEFLMGAAKRDYHDTAQLKWQSAQRYVSGHAQRLLTNRRTAILNGSAPAWENGISYYPERIPATFGRRFRQLRNIASGHVTDERSNLSMSRFYDQNHKYLYLLYYDAKSWWGRQTDEFPDLNEITAFSVLVEHEPPPTQP